MLERLPETGAIVTDAAYDVVAWNPLAQALPRRLRRRDDKPGRRRFLGQGRMHESSSAEEFGHIVVARLRRAADRYPHDAQLTALLAELHAEARSSERSGRRVRSTLPGTRTKTLDHPKAGVLRLNCDVLLVPEDDQEVVLITGPGSPAARTLRSLRRGPETAGAGPPFSAAVARPGAERARRRAR